MAVDRRRLLIGGAVGVVVVLALAGLWPSAPPARPSAPPGAAQPARPKAELGPMAPVKLDDLKASREGPGEAGRNPFRFQPKPAPPPPKMVAPPPQTTLIEQPRVNLPPPGPPPAPPIPLKLIGVLERANGVKWAVLTDGKSPSPMSGRDGEIIDGRYMIVKIGTESVEMTYADGRGRQVIRLTGQ
jgi:hypothetical protein